MEFKNKNNDFCVNAFSSESENRHHIFYIFKRMIYQDWAWSCPFLILQSLVATPFWQTWWFNLFTFVLLIIIILFISKIRLNQIEETRKKQLEFAKQLINAQEIERQRIAAELHDSIGQNLLIIKNRALLGLNSKSDKNFINEQLDEISATASRALDETRLIARNLLPLHLQRFGLTKALTDMFEQIENSSGIEFQTQIDEIDGLFKKNEELNIFRIIQECLNNLVKHSETKTASVEITNTKNSLKITVQDFGKGFQFNLHSSSQTKFDGFGLFSVKQRVEMLGGNIKIDSKIGTGTVIIILLGSNNG